MAISLPFVTHMGAEARGTLPTWATNACHNYTIFCGMMGGGVRGDPAADHPGYERVAGWPASAGTMCSALLTSLVAMRSSHAYPCLPLTAWYATTTVMGPATHFM